MCTQKEVLPTHKPTQPGVRKLTFTNMHLVPTPFHELSYSNFHNDHLGQR